MDISTASAVSGLAAGTVGGSIDTNLIASVNNLQEIVVSKLFASLGLGQNVNTYA